MGTTFPRFRLGVAAALLALATTACAAQEHVYRPPLAQPALVQVDVYDRTDGSSLPVYAKDARRYIVGTPGHEYALRIRNRTGARVLVVTSVDGVNVISGDTAAPSQSGYVLDPWGSVEIIGWRKSLERTAAFYFTEHQNSYAARTGRPDNVGVIGVAVFREKAQPIARSEPRPAPRPLASQSDTRSTMGIRGLEDGSLGEAARGTAANEASSQPAPMDYARRQSKLGTGHGRDEASQVRMVDFQRASDTPSETVAIQYDRRENLVAMGVLPRSAQYSRREPQPFPGEVRFVPDPR